MQEAILKQSRRQRVTNYSQVDPIAAEVCTLRSLPEAQALLQAAKATGQTITFRGAGDSLHDQAQGHDLVVQVAMPSEVSMLSPDTVRGSAGTTWLDVWRASAPHHRVPGVTPNSAKATLGGTLSANCLCQFSPVLGKESSGVEAISMLSASGEVVELTRPDDHSSEAERRLFYTVIGGLGSLGLVTHVTHRLLSFPFSGPARIQSCVTSTSDAGELLRLLVDAHIANHPTESASSAVPWGGKSTLERPSPVGLIHTKGPGCRIEKSFVPADAPRDPYLLHSRKSFTGIFGNFVVSLPFVRARFWDGVHEGWRTRSAPFVDDVQDALFSMESNRTARALMRRVGLVSICPQQTFVLPIKRGAAPSLPAERFVEAIFRQLADDGLDASLIDVMTLPADKVALSSTREMEGVAITVSFQQFGRKKLPQIKATLLALSETCAALGGRVHLVKNVFVAPDVLQEMYSEGLAQWQEAKARLDPDGLFGSALFARLFGGELL